MFNRIALRSLANISPPLLRALPATYHLRSPGQLFSNLQGWYSTKAPTLRVRSQQPSDEDNLFLQQNTQKWQVDCTAVLTSYPFHHIPIVLIRNPTKFSIPEPVCSQLIAFKCLSIVEKDLPAAIQLILPEQYRYSQYLEVKSGQQLFDLYFQGRVPALVELINQGKGPLAERVIAMKAIAHLTPKALAQHMKKQLEERSIVKEDPSGVLAAEYISFLIKNQRNYTHMIPLLMEKLQQHDNPSHSKLAIAKSIISTPGFQQHYPEKIIDLALTAFAEQLPHLHNYQVLFSIRPIYNYESAASRRYAEALLKHVMTTNIGEDRIDYHVPLILKIIKYCSKQRLSCDPLLEFISKNMVRFKIIFTNKNISKGQLFSLIFTKTSGKDVSDEVVGYLKDFFFNGIKDFTQAEELQEIQLIRFSKLLLKFFWKLSEAEQQNMRRQYLNYMLPNFSHSSQVLLYSLLVILRQKRIPPQKTQRLPDFHRQTQNIKKYLLQYFASCCSMIKQEFKVVRNLNSVVELMYQIDRHQLQFSKEQLPALIKYDFTAKETLQPDKVSLFFSYLTHCKEPKEDIKRVIGQLEPQLELYFKKKKINSIKTIFSILDICDRVSYEHPFFYKIVENTLADYIINTTQYIKDNDIKFINNKLIKRGYGSRNLQQFVKGVLDNSKNWASCKKEYAQKEKSFRERLASKRQK